MAKFIAIFPEVSLDWLILGRGEMTRRPAEEAPPDGLAEMADKLIDAKDEIIDLQREQISALKEMIRLMKEAERR